MGNLFVLYSALAVFGVGITVIDFLGVLDHTGSHDDSGHDDSGHDGPEDHGSTEHDDGADHGTDHGDHTHLSYLSPGTTGIRAVTIIMGTLRTIVYFSLGFGPTGLFAAFSGLSRTAGFLWACGVGTAMAVFARLLRRFIRRDLDSSIRSDEFLMEEGILLLPLEGGVLSKAAVRQFGKETELYVRCKDVSAKLAKGCAVRIVDYDNNVYWVEPV